jgi:DNA-binding PucR family transcriptional regulator
VLEGVSVDIREASRRLGYRLNGTHQAAILWIEEAESELSRLDEAAETLIALYGQTPVMLRVIANTATVWLWINDKSPPHLQRLQAYLKDHPGVKIALGSGDKGVEGFRRAHLDALAAQRVMSRLNSPAQAASFDSLRLVALMSRDPEATLRFVNHTLGELVHAPIALKRSLLAFLQSGCNATEAAERLHTHRNTVIKRLDRAQELLPGPLDTNRLHVAAALEALSWMAAD